MNILLHGAVNGSNFGDCLFADIFYHRIYKSIPNANIFFSHNRLFGISDYLCEELKYERNKYKIDDMDCLVYISGGYFGEDNRSIIQSIKRYFRYFAIAKRFIRRKKKIYIVGVEVGPIHYSFMKKEIRKILSYASIVIVRNKESYDYCKELGIENCILSADTALTVNKDGNRFFQSSTYRKNKKKIFIHVQPNDPISDDFVDRILNPVIRFVKNNSSYYVVFGTDSLEKNINIDRIESIFSKNSVEIEHYKYNDYWEFCRELNSSDIVITRRLHVGILGCLFSKCVFSTPIHKYKTIRFYKQISYETHCIPYSEVTGNIFYNMLSELYSDNACVSNSLIELTAENFNLFIDRLRAVER